MSSLRASIDLSRLSQPPLRPTQFLHRPSSTWDRRDKEFGFMQVKHILRCYN